MFARLQVKPALASSFFTGSRMRLQCFSTRMVRPTVTAVRAAAAAAETEERYRLNNLSPQPGARKQKNRKGRGYGAGQVRTEYLLPEFGVFFSETGQQG